MVQRTEYDKVEPYITRDGALVRELMHPDIHGNSNQSLAEAIVLPESETMLHIHREAEEFYHVTSGTGVMTLGHETFPVKPGDTICIPPGTVHRVKNTGKTPLVVLCCCTPPYSHEDTELVD